MQDESVRLHAFQTLLDGSEHATEPLVELTALRRLCARGIPSHPPHLRPLAWSLLLEVLPIEKRQWRQTNRTHRDRYHALVRTFMDDLDKLDTPSHPACPSDALLTQLSKDLERIFSSSAFFKSRTAPNRASPLAPPTSDFRAALSSDSEEEGKLGEGSMAIMNRRAAFRRLDMIAEAEHMRARTSNIDRKGKGKALGPPVELEIQSTQRMLRPLDTATEPVLSPRITLSMSGSSSSAPSPAATPTQSQPLSTPQLSLSIPSAQSSFSASPGSKAPSPITLLSPKPLPRSKLPFTPDSPALPGSLLQPDTHGESILRILYVFVKAHPQWEYTQGFADVLLPLYMIYALGGDGDTGPQGLKKSKRKAQKTPGDQSLVKDAGWGRYAEEDTFWAFAAMMGEMGGVVAGPPKGGTWETALQVDGVKAALDKLGRRVRWADEDLWIGLRKRNLDPATPYYAYRWVALLLARDLPSRPLLPVWDFMLSQPSTTADGSPKVDLVLDICTAMLLLIKDDLFRPPKQGRTDGKTSVASTSGLWGLANEEESDTATADFDPKDPDALGEAFAHGMRLLQNYPLSSVGGIGAVLDVAFNLQQARLLAYGSKDDPDSPAWVEVKAVQDARESWSSSAVRKVAGLAGSKLWAGTAAASSAIGVRPSFESVVTSETSASSASSLFRKYTDAIQHSDAAASVAKTSTSWSALAMAKWNSASSAKHTVSVQDETNRSASHGSNWSSLGGVAERLLGTAVRSNPRDTAIPEDKYTAIPSPPPTPQRLRNSATAREFTTPGGGLSASISHRDSPPPVLQRDRSDSTSSARSTLNLQDRLAGLASSLSSSTVLPGSTSPPILLAPSGPKPLLLSGSARRASNSPSTPASISRSTYQRAPLLGQDSPSARSTLSPPIKGAVEYETDQTHRTVPIGRHRSASPSYTSFEAKDPNESDSSVSGQAVSAAAIRLRNATSVNGQSPPSLPRSQGRHIGLSDRDGKVRLTGRRPLDRSRPMSGSSVDIGTAASSPGGPGSNDVAPESRQQQVKKYSLTDAGAAVPLANEFSVDVDENSMTWIANGTHASVCLAQSLPSSTLASTLCAIKIVHPGSEPAPHSILREIRILTKANHPQVASILHSTQDFEPPTIKLYLPFYPVSLANVISSTAFIPTHTVANHDPLFDKTDFLHVTRSICFQVLLAITHIHNMDPPVAHRDLKPENIMIDNDGTVKLIDFATAWEQGNEVEDTGAVCQVGSGPYRAPELLFGPHRYDAQALDLWAAGATLAELFTPFRLCAAHASTAIDVDHLSSDGGPLPGCLQYDSEGSDTDTDRGSEEGSSAISPDIPTQREWRRLKLFEGNKGDLGLAWSLFRICGTPSPITWPDYETLPDAGKMQYTPMPPVSLARLLPLAPSPAITELISAFLKMSPSRRMGACDALNHDCFNQPVIIPESTLDAETVWYGQGKNFVRLAQSRVIADGRGLLRSLVKHVVLNQRDNMA